MKKYQQLYGLLGLVMVSILTSPVIAQVSLAPTILYVHENRSIGEIYITNTAQTAQELTFRTEFSYPRQTEDGQLLMVSDDSLTAQKYGLDNHIRVFPSRMVLQPGQSQVVRIQVLPMDKPDGVYWSRFVASSSELTPEVGTSVVNGVGTQINFVVEQNIPLFFRKGENTTGVKVVDFKTEITEEGLEVMPKIERTGNSPFLGTMIAELYDENDQLIGEVERSAFFYFEDWTKISFPLDTSDSIEGNYRISIKFITQRNSISTADIVTSDLIVYEERIRIMK
jgi:hypothetical protein